MATYDIAALKADLPTAKELAQFVYDKVHVNLDFIGKPKEDQYKVAKVVLEGGKFPSEYASEVNPYLDKKELIPVDQIKSLPERNKNLPPVESRIHFFGATNMPHPSPSEQGSNKTVHISFYKYDNGMLTFQIMGPIEQIAIGKRVNKFGQEVPESYSWIDPRTAEEVLRRPDGSYTEQGRKLYAYCVGEKGSGIWPLIDKEILDTIAKNITNPWA